MHIILEEHQYEADKVARILDGITTLRDLDGMISVNYVGYYYNPTLKDCVFILPKVLLEDIKETGPDGKEKVVEKVFGHCNPEDIIDLDHQNCLTKEEHDFIYELSVWIYRAIVVFRDTTNSNIVKQQYVQQMSKGRLQKSNTFLDILLALQKFNKDNQDFFFFVLKNIHSGFNKINWTRTISHSQAFLQDDSPIYINPVNKKRKVNFDEELLIIFFSILNYMHEHYGFPVKLNINFPLITGQRFQNYLDGMGKVRMMQIKYKYFSDKALYLWELCHAFFERSKKINVETDDKEYLLVKNFNIVFEEIIDELVGEKDLPKGLADQEDGKRVDHLYQYKNLTNNTDNNTIYYIGDSKYYKRKTPIGPDSVYKQFTYARNVIQWNLDLFNDGTEEEQKEHFKLRDEITEGYNIIPNFFISAEQKNLKREDDIKLTSKDSKYFESRQFDNRLFDRDTFLIAHYDVNFLFVVALYGQNNPHDKLVWREKVRKMFRKEIQEMLGKKFDFYAMTAHADTNAVAYLEDHFQELLGKVYTPYEDRGLQKFYSLALDNREKFKDENEAILEQLEQFFYVKKCNLGTDPTTLFEYIEPKGIGSAQPANFLTQHFLENYLDKQILIGMYHDQKHLDWITGKNDKGTKLYNIRLTGRAGGQTQSSLLKRVVSFVILYQKGHEADNKYMVYHVHHHATMDEERMRKAWYPNPQGKYFCYVFDEQVSLGNINLSQLLEDYTFFNPDHTYGAPIFMTGRELMEYRKG